MVANSEDPDQMSSSDLGLLSLHMSQYWDAMLIWVNHDKSSSCNFIKTSTILMACCTVKQTKL